MERSFGGGTRSESTSRSLKGRESSSVAQEGDRTGSEGVARIVTMFQVSNLASSHRFASLDLASHLRSSASIPAPHAHCPEGRRPTADTSRARLDAGEPLDERVIRVRASSRFVCPTSE